MIRVLSDFNKECCCRISIDCPNYNDDYHEGGRLTSCMAVT